MVIIIFYGEYPNNDSWPNRIRHTVKIFSNKKLDNKIVIPYPPLNPSCVVSEDLGIVRLQKSNKIKRNFILDLFFFLKGIIRSYQYIKKQEEIDFVFFAGGSYIICYPILLLCKTKGIKVWIDIVDENSKKFEKQKSLRDYLAIFNKDLFDKWLVPKFDKVFVISSYLFDKYKKSVPLEKLIKSPPTIIDIDEFDINSTRKITNKSKDLDQVIFDKRLKLLYAGSVVRPNGIFFVMDCAAELITKYNFDFIIVIIVLIGDKSRIIEHAVDLGIESNLFLLESQSQKDMPAIYKQVDILFLPEHGNTIANAGFPGKTAELLASGKPVIATIFSDLQLYLKNRLNAMISPIGDKITYINNLRFLLIDEDLRKCIGEKGRETAINSFDYKKLDGLYQ